MMISSNEMYNCMIIHSGNYLKVYTNIFMIY